MSRIKAVSILIFIFVVSMSSSGFSQGFDGFLSRVGFLADSGRVSVVDSFMSATKSFPVIEKDSVVHFIYRGSATSVQVPGDANNWQPAALSMSNIPGTNFWYVTQTYPPDARLEYKFVTNGNNWILDPLNPGQIVEGFGPNSELRMPKYVPPPEVQYYPDIPHGTEVDTMLYSPDLSNSRKISVYLPAAYKTSTDSYPTVYFQDGSEAVSLEKIENVIDYLTAHNMIRPVIAVFVPYVNRTPEYAGNQVNQFMSFYVNGVVHCVDSSFRTIETPQGRAVIGASYGGNISLWLGSTYPGIFGNVGAQSSYVDPSIASRFQNGAKLDLKIYMDLGTYDIPSLIPMVQDFVQTIKTRGYDYEYYEFNEGHSWGNWRAHVKNALIKFFPPVQTGIRQLFPRRGDYSLGQNFPNPFNPTTVISYKLPAVSDVSLKIYDILGRELVTLVKGRQKAGKYSVTFDGSGLASGVYFYRLWFDGSSLTGRSMLIK